jgi:hypothetical protein
MKDVKRRTELFSELVDYSEIQMDVVFDLLEDFEGATFDDLFALIANKDQLEGD